jgi:hypothetical protein
VIRDTSWERLEGRLKQWYAPNPPPPDLRSLVEDYMCDYLPDGFCAQKGAHSGLSLAQLTSFSDFMSRTLLAKLRKEEVYVSEAEALRRAKICSACEFNARSFCSSCLGLSQRVMGLLPASRRDMPELKIGACGKCGCLLEAKVNFRREVLEPLFFKRPDYPGHCWMNDHE